ncbi:hypothetical protein LF63_0109385 [Oleiagrimonas soli]|nr:hypothetical protein LF63_0109385 [Oleiagrimonas soli]
MHAPQTARESAATQPKRVAPARPAATEQTTTAKKSVAQDSHALNGTLQLKAAGGQHVSAADFANTVVYFVPSTGDARPRPGTYTVYTHNRDFDPAWLAIPEGSTVTFTNLDQVTHNVFSVTPGAGFDLGYQSAGQSDPHRFDQPGMVLISCHVHRYMKGGVLVVPSRYVTTVSANGHFRLRHLPHVSGTLYFWNPRSQAATQQIALPFSAVRQQLVIDQPSVKTQIDVGGGS